MSDKIDPPLILVRVGYDHGDPLPSGWELRTINYEAARQKALDILLNDASLLADPYPAIVNAAIGITE